MAWNMIWPGKHGMVYDMALRAWHGICSGLVGMAWYMVLLGGPCMVYGMSLQAWHVYGIAWRGMDLHMVWLGRMTCIWYGLSGVS